jgi:hypothetical protein
MLFGQPVLLLPRLLFLLLLLLLLTFSLLAARQQCAQAILQLQQLTSKAVYQRLRS